MAIGRVLRVFLSAAVVLGASGLGEVRGQGPPDLNALGEDLASQIAPKIIAKAPTSGKFRVAAFPFGDKDGKVSMRMGMSPQILQGAIADALGPKLALAAPGKFNVLTDVGLKATFDTLGLAPDGVTPKDLDAARKVLAKAGIQVGIVGSFDMDDTTTLTGAGASPVKVALTAVYASGQDTCDSSVMPNDLANNGGVADPTATPSGRYGARIFYKPDDSVDDKASGAWVEIPLQISKDPKSDTFNVYFLVLDPMKHKGKRYKVVLKNAGTPPALAKLLPAGVSIPPPANEKDRLFAVALLIDGVNSFYQGTPAGPVVVHPQLAAKWVLTGPGKRLVPDPAGTPGPTGTPKPRIENGRLDNVSGDGGSVVEVMGFQKNAKFGDSFVFSDADASIAETAGLTNDVGMIAAHFYPEDLPGDPRFSMMAGGTTVGREFPNAVYKVRFELHQNAIEVIRIFYRYSGDPTLPTLTPVTGP